MTDENQRKAPRSRVLKSAKIVGANNWSVVDCVVRDLSETGAKLIIGDNAAVANEFMLLMTSDRTIRDARVIWRKEETIGIEFTSPKRPAPSRKF